MSVNKWCVLQHEFDLLIDSYIGSEVGQCQNFLSGELAQRLRGNLTRLLEEDVLRAAGIGQDADLTLDLDIRRDKIHWLDRGHNDAAELEFFTHMDSFVSYLNQTCYTGITGYEFHYAHYGKGAFYKRHLDQFRGDDARAFSVIMYLNDNWQPGDGGELVVYLPDGELMIQPLGGTCVFFNSSQLEHEVLVSNKSRMSITGWLRRDAVV